MSTSTQRIEEGFRVLTLQYPISEDVKEFIEEYRVLASHLYWCKRLGLEPSKEVVEKLWERVPSYWRWHLVDRSSVDGGSQPLIFTYFKAPHHLLLNGLPKPTHRRSSPLVA